MGWLITLGILFLLAILPLGVSIRYDEDGPLVKLIAGPLRMLLFPRTKKDKKEKKGTAEKKKGKPTETGNADSTLPAEEENLPEPPRPPKPEKTKKTKGEKGGSITDFLPFVQMGLDFLGDFRRKLRLNELYLRLIMASADPCDLAVNYGRAWAALGNLMPALERLFVIKKRDVEVECDFTASQTLVIARLDIFITLGRLLSLAAVYGFRALKEFLNFKKKRKGGAAK